MRSRRKKQGGCWVRLPLFALLGSLLGLGGTFLAVNENPLLLAKALGFEHRGAVSLEVAAEPGELLIDGPPLDHVDVVLPPQVNDPLSLSAHDVESTDSLLEPLLGNAAMPDKTVYVLTIDEASLNQLIRTWILPQDSEDGSVRDLTVDLQPGGLIVYKDVDLGFRQHRMGLLLRQDGSGLTMSPVGFVLNGELYALPATATLARFVLPTGREVGRTLNALTFTGPLPGEARPTRVRLESDRLQVEAEATYSLSSLPDTGWRVLEEGVELREVEVVAGADLGSERLRIVKLDASDFDIHVHYDPVNPAMVSTWAAQSDALLVVNGGYFTEESDQRHETIGLLISDGDRWGTPLQDFAGMLAVRTDGDASVRWLRHTPYDPTEPLDHALQSFPVLVRPGGIMGFPADADEGVASRRTVVAQDGNGNLLWIVGPRGTLSLHELAVFLTGAALDIDVAVNLDGGRSTGMWLTAESGHVNIDSITPVPSVIAVTRR